MSARPTVIVTEQLADAPLHWLAERCDVQRIGSQDIGFRDAVREADAMVIRTYTTVDRDTLAGAARLLVIGRAGVGVDNIDLAACRERGVHVVYTPDANTQAVVEYVFAIILDALRTRPRVAGALLPDDWRAMREECLDTHSLGELTVGILGLGRIGKRVAAVARSFGCEVIYHDVIEIDSQHRHGARPVSAEQLFAEADVLTVHVDGRPGNRGFVGSSLLDRMKPGVMFLNTSRGFVVDSAALAAAMEARPAARAFIDVHEPEPIKPSYPLLGLANVELYPHVASRTARSIENMSWVVRDVVAVLEGREPQHAARVV